MDRLPKSEQFITRIEYEFALTAAKMVGASDSEVMQAMVEGTYPEIRKLADEAFSHKVKQGIWDDLMGV
jgi:hypothetical protein